MSTGNNADVAIVGGGIVGLAHAYMCLLKGYKVVLFERDTLALGASVRNFGLIWPIGQDPEAGLDLAFRSRMHWLEIASQAGIWINQNGSLHLAYHDDEWNVLNEFVELYKHAPFICSLLNPERTVSKSSIVKKENLKGSLWSETECTVNPREAIRKLPAWMQEQMGLILRYGQTVKEIRLPSLETNREQWNVNYVFVCSGADFETLYPHFFDEQPITKCKLQMMKALLPANIFHAGPSLCAGLTLRHYAAFSKCPSLKKVDTRYDQEDQRLKQNGIHVLLSQNNYNELIIGDSHHYYQAVEPFDSVEIDEVILDYLGSFTNLKNLSIKERWHGVYPKLEGSNHLIHEIVPGVRVVNGLGGAGMTLSFGVAEKAVSHL
jgi:FAD dependent oxidoreductase TIGR03364